MGLLSKLIRQFLETVEQHLYLSITVLVLSGWTMGHMFQQRHDHIAAIIALLALPLLITVNVIVIQRFIK